MNIQWLAAFGAANVILAVAHQVSAQHERQRGNGKVSGQTVFLGITSMLIAVSSAYSVMDWLVKNIG